MLSIIEIKKALYKNKPKAFLHHVRKIGVKVSIVYMSQLPVPDEKPIDLIFDVPVEELGDGLYAKEMRASMLIRYLVEPENIEA
jgi:hypothetical protein